MVYSHGGDIYGSEHIRIDFSVNTNPLGTPREVIEAVASSREEILLYPDSQCRGLRKALAASHSLPEDWILCGNGAADLIFGLAEALRPRRAILFAPCFSEYEAALSLKGCEIIQIPLRPEENWLPDARCLERKLERVGGADLVFLGNPNNPTGMALSSEELEVFAGICRNHHALLAVDECFNGFLERPEGFTMAGKLGRYRNLFLLNAFTKTYGMAGLRLGYAMCADTGLLERLAAVRQPWSVSGIAQKAGIAALSRRDFLEQARELIARERKFLSDGLSRLGFRVWPSMANYLLFSVGQKGKELSGQEDLKKFLSGRGILIRSCASYRGLDDSFFRVAVKRREENKELLSQMEEWARKNFSSGSEV